MLEKTYLIQKTEVRGKGNKKRHKIGKNYKVVDVNITLSVIT